jgi:hypothetical protein
MCGRTPARALPGRHIIGNIGHSGLTMLIASNNPRIRHLSDDYMIIRDKAAMAATTVVSNQSCQAYTAVTSKI